MVVMVVHRFCSQMIQCQQLIGGLDFLLWTQALPWGIHLRMAYPRKAGFGGSSHPVGKIQFQRRKSLLPVDFNVDDSTNLMTAPGQVLKEGDVITKDFHRCTLSVQEVPKNGGRWIAGTFSRLAMPEVHRDYDVFPNLFFNSHDAVPLQGGPFIFISQFPQTQT